MDFLFLLFSAESPDVGVYANSPDATVTVLGVVVPKDRFYGCLFWFLLLVLGSIIQIKRLNKVARKLQEQGEVSIGRAAKDLAVGLVGSCKP